jgi:hydrogenase maturation protease
MTKLPHCDTVLLIGYGNTLRGDDGLGPHTVAAVAALALPGVRTRIVQQLLPELAAELAEVRCAIFVDARLAPADDTLQVTTIGPGPAAAVMAHTGDPRNLLALAQTLYGRAPEAWLVTVPGRDFDLGERLSDVGTAQSGVALTRIRELIAAYR